MPTQRTRKGVPSQAARDSIVETRSAFFAAERAAPVGRRGLRASEGALCCGERGGGRADVLV